MNRKNATLLIAAAIMGGSLGHSLAADDKTAELAASRCAICHGPRGEGTSSAFPRLAGQRAEYIEAQLKAFRAKTRADPFAQAYMWAVASQLRDEDIRNLAIYYEQVKPVSEDSKLLSDGKRIFEAGVPEERILPCASCHGGNAEGRGQIPRLAGQHAPYLVKQMLYFQSTRRGGEVHVMHAAIGEGMTMQQMEAVAAYAASK